MNATFKRRRGRIGTLMLVLAGLFVLAALRLVVLVALDGPRLNSLARSEHTGELMLAAPRGPIVDHNGEPLAMSAETRSVYARPRKVLENTTPAQRAPLADALGIGADQLELRLHHHAPFVWLARHLAPERADTVEAMGLDGVGALSEYERFYPESNLAEGVVGLAGMDGQGLSGVELHYDHLIRGEPIALHFYRDAMGHAILDSPLALKNPEPGARLELTIDAEIQSLAVSQLTDEVKQSGARRGTAIVLDPFSGEVLAMANVSAERCALNNCLHNPAVEDAFEPGSTMKGILGAIALEDRVIDTERKLYCENGEFEVGGRWIHDHGHHGWLSLGEIVEVSSNIGAAKIALALGADRYYQGLRAFGVGRKTGIDLPGEAGGLLRAPTTWHEIDLANHGFGQGVALTPIQLAVAYAAIANGGWLVRPFVVKAAYDPDGRPILTHTPQVLGRAVSPAAAHIVNMILRGVVNGTEGTGRRARVDDFTVAGKTGTAQMINPDTGGYYQSRLVASFVGFVPADDPRLVILVVLEDVNHGHFGGLVAAPVFSAIASGALRHLNVAAKDSFYETASLIPGENLEHQAAELAQRLPDVPLSPAGGSAATPDFLGLSLRRALALGRRHSINIEVEGSGYVIRQEPAPRTALNHCDVKLTLAPEPPQISLRSPTGDGSPTAPGPRARSRR
ncbi:MAG: penicillin-binding transpeptidase domain-containing protein [Candidatus Binataceae bacterium]